MPILTDALYERHCGANRQSICNWRLRLAAVLPYALELYRHSRAWRRRAPAMAAVTAAADLVAFASLAEGSAREGALLL